MSKKINWSAEAIEMIDAYKNAGLHIPCADGQKMRGLMVDADHVLEILQNPNHTITKLFMVFGLKGDQSFNIVLVGIDDKGKIVADPAYDYADPCPDQCADLP
jgi:hypothetical protein